MGVITTSQWIYHGESSTLNVDTYRDVLEYITISMPPIPPVYYAVNYNLPFGVATLSKNLDNNKSPKKQWKRKVA